MATVGDPNIKPKPPLWQIIFNVIYSAMGVVKTTMGFNKGKGPKL